MNRFNRETGEFTHFRNDPDDPTSLSANAAFSLFEDQTRTLWVGTSSGLNRFDRDREAFTRYQHDPADSNSLSDGIIISLYEDREGVLWAGTLGGGLNRFDRERTVFTHYQHDPANPHSLNQDQILALYEDRSGVLWFGTSAGINTYDRRQEVFTHYQHDPANPNSLSSNTIWRIHEDPAGILWIGTDLGLNRLDRATNTVTRYQHDPANPHSLSGNIIVGLTEDHTGTLWVGTDNGLDKMDRATGRFTRYTYDAADTTTLSNHDARAIWEDRQGVLWVGTWVGLNRFDRESETFTRYLHDPADTTSVSSNNIETIYEDRSGVVWIATWEGLNVYDRATDSFVRYVHDPNDPQSLSHNRVFSIWEDRGGVLWVGTGSGGLNKLDRRTRTFSHYRTKDGLPSDVIYGILEDAQGFLWLSTNNGLARFDPQTESFQSYHAQDGLWSNEFNSGAYARGADGTLLFGGITGVTAFDPAHLQHDTDPPPVVLTAVKTFYEPAPLSTAASVLQDLQLSYRDYVFSFEFAALDYHAPEKNRFAYKMEGFKEEWIDLGGKHDVTFTNLDPGAYTFRVKAANSNGDWNETGLALGVTVTPPFWKRWWFRLTGLLLLIGLIGAGYSLRTRAIRTRNRRLEAINSELNQHIAERKQAEAERERLLTQMEMNNVALASNNAELEARNAEMERFTYTVSHDLKTPLVTIKGFLGLLEQDTADGNVDRMQSDIAKIHKAADRMSSLLGDLLDLSRVGRLMNPPEAVPLTELAEEAAALVAGSIAARGVAVEVARSMPVVFGDRLRLLEVFQNLLDNAVKFMGHQAAPRIEIGAEIDGEAVVCFVRDNGIGISPAYHEKVFGLFERLDVQAVGTGIGLALVRRIVEIHGGRLWVESQGEGQGSTFRFTLPPPP